MNRCLNHVNITLLQARETRVFHSVYKRAHTLIGNCTTQPIRKWSGQLCDDVNNNPVQILAIQTKGLMHRADLLSYLLSVASCRNTVNANATEVTASDPK